jgi:hypothetical protein
VGGWVLNHDATGMITQQQGLQIPHATQAARTHNLHHTHLGNLWNWANLCCACVQDGNTHTHERGPPTPPRTAALLCSCTVSFRSVTFAHSWEKENRSLIVHCTEYSRQPTSSVG